MDQSYSSTKLPTAASQVTSGDGASWLNPSNITADDGSSSTLTYTTGGDFGAGITGTDFDFQQLPDSAVIDGIEVYIDGSQTGCYGTIALNITDTDTKDLGTLSGSYGGTTDLWGLDVIDPADIANIELTVTTGDVSGGDGIASINYVSITIYWHIELAEVPTDIDTRVVYKIYSNKGKYLGELPNVSSKFGFAQDINSAGTSITVTCGSFVNNEVTTAPLLDENGDIITTEDDLPILTTNTELQVLPGNSVDDAIFKNGNRVKIWLYNQYYPNGKLEFSGQINRVSFRYGGGDATVKLTIYSDGLDLNNYVARGYPFSYTLDVSQTSNNTTAITSQEGGKGTGWNRYGQTWKTGAGVTTLGSIRLRLVGTATVTLSVYDAPNGNLLGTVTKSLKLAAATEVQFDFPSLIDVTELTEYFYSLSVAPGQSITSYHSTANPYANGKMWVSTYSGGSGGASWSEVSGGTRDMYFKTYSGVPTTTTTYSTDDPVTDMAHGILLDYNDRGGLVTERNFQATGLSITYTFVVALIYDAIKKILELSPTGYYAYVDVGTAEIDILPTSTTPDFIVVKGRHINELNLDMTIEQVKNYLLLTGGETAGVNLYRDYKNNESASNYGLRTGAKTDNRVTVTATADAIGATFIEENSQEIQETTLTVLNEHIDITQLTPGKTIGFRNFGNFIDDLVLQIVRREPNYSDGIVSLTLGRLPTRMTDEIQRINRAILNEQTINNPSSPS